MSAYSNLAGLYAATDNVTWDDRYIKWQLVPVHTVAAESDEVV